MTKFCFGGYFWKCAKKVINRQKRHFGGLITFFWVCSKILTKTTFVPIENWKKNWFDPQNSMFLSFETKSFTKYFFIFFFCFCFKNNRQTNVVWVSIFENVCLGALLEKLKSLFLGGKKKFWKLKFQKKSALFLWCKRNLHANFYKKY